MIRYCVSLVVDGCHLATAMVFRPAVYIVRKIPICHGLLGVSHEYGNDVSDANVTAENSGSNAPHFSWPCRW